MTAITHPIRGVKALTIDTEAPVGRLFIANCTVAGNVSVTLYDNSTHIIALEVGYATFPYAVRKFNTTGTTATATYANGI